MKQSQRAYYKEWQQGIRDSAPISLSILLFGAIFGLLSIQAGLSSWQASLMSFVVFAGGAQFAALSMLGEHASIGSIILTTFLLNSRHFLMGLSISPYYGSYSRKFINISAFFLGDEQYALTLNRFQNHPSTPAYILSVSFSIFTSWQSGTWIGTAVGNWIPDPSALGLGFSFTLLFLALAYYQLMNLFRIITFLCCGAGAVWLALLLPSGLHLLAIGLVAFAIGYFADHNNSSKEVQTA